MRAYWYINLALALFFAVKPAGEGAEPAEVPAEEEVEYVVVLSKVFTWEDTIPSDKDLKIYFDVDKAMSYLFALYGGATTAIYTPYGIWKPSGITDPDVAAEVAKKLPPDGKYYMLPAGGESGEYYLILTKTKRNRQVDFTLEQYTVYKFEKPKVEKPPENDAVPREPNDWSLGPFGKI